MFRDYSVRKQQNQNRVLVVTAGKQSMYASRKVALLFLLKYAGTDVLLSSEIYRY